jgi:predicted MPP superfamily phosphohydrolase
MPNICSFSTINVIFKAAAMSGCDTGQVAESRVSWVKPDQPGKIKKIFNVLIFYMKKLRKKSM